MLTRSSRTIPCSRFHAPDEPAQNWPKSSSDVLDACSWMCLCLDFVALNLSQSWICPHEHRPAFSCEGGFRRFIVGLQVLEPRSLFSCQMFVRIYLSTNRIHFVMTVKTKAIKQITLAFNLASRDDQRPQRGTYEHIQHGCVVFDGCDVGGKPISKPSPRPTK